MFKHFLDDGEGWWSKPSWAYLFCDLRLREKKRSETEIDRKNYVLRKIPIFFEPSRLIGGWGLGLFVVVAKGGFFGTKQNKEETGGGWKR